MELLDGLVIDAVIGHVLRPTRLQHLQQSWLDRSEQAQVDRREQIRLLRSRLTMLEGESANVIKLVRAGICQPDDPQIATELGNIAAQKKAVAVDIEALERQLATSGRKVTPDALQRFGVLMAQKLKGSDRVARRDHVRILVDRVEVGKQMVRIVGSKNALSAAAAGIAPHMVPKAERNWRARQDSNLRPRA